MSACLHAAFACVHAQRHTAENIDKWTEEAFKDIGLTLPELTGKGDAEDPLGYFHRLTLEDLVRLGFDEERIERCLSLGPEVSALEQPDADEFIFMQSATTGPTSRLHGDLRSGLRAFATRLNCPPYRSRGCRNARTSTAHHLG